MPSQIYEAELSDGRIVEFESDHEPSHEELLAAIGGNKPAAPEPPPAPAPFTPKDNPVTRAMEVFAGGEFGAPMEISPEEAQKNPEYLTASPVDVIPEVPVKRITEGMGPWTGFGAGLALQVPNAVRGVGKFLASPMGEASIIAGGVAPLTTTGLFTADMVKNIWLGSKDLVGRWNELTPGERGAAVTDILASAYFAKKLGKETIKGVLNKIPVKEPAARTPEQDFVDEHQTTLPRAAAEAAVPQKSTGEAIFEGLMADNPEQRINEVGGSNASSIQETATSLPSRISGRGGIPDNIIQAARGVSEAIRKGDADDLQHQLTGSGLDQDQLRGLISLLPESEQAALQTFGQMVSGGRSFSEAAQAAVTFFGREEGTGSITDKISANENARIAAEKAGGPGQPIGEQGKTSLATSGTQQERELKYASQNTTAAAIHGALRPLAGQGQGEMPLQEGGERVQPQAPGRVAKEAPLLLSAEEQAYLDAERAGISAPVEVTETLPDNAPFAGRVATIDRPTGRILINPGEFRDWLGRVPAERRAQAVRSLLGEEQIHLGVDDASASGFWDTLTRSEKLINQRRYTGKWGGVPEVDALNMGHEALRFRLQQLARMTPREIVESAGREHWTVQSLTALETAIRTIRESLGTKASKEGRAILDRMQENLGAVQTAAAGGRPAAYNKKRKETSAQGFLDLPPLPGSQAVERAAPWKDVKPSDIEAAAGSHFDRALEQGKAPSFEDFTGELAGQFGSGIRKESLFYPWQDAMAKRLMKAPGAQIEAMADRLGLRREIADTLNRSSMGKIADPIEMPAIQMEIGEIARQFRLRKTRTAAAWREKFGPQMQRRYTAIGSIMDKLIGQAGEKPVKPWERSEVGPEDIDQKFSVTKPAAEVSETGDLTTPEVETSRAFRSFTPDEIADPAKIADAATRGAATDATGKGALPRSVSKNLIALLRPDGKVALVSVWKDPRSGPRVTNPGGATLDAQKLNPYLLSMNQPLAVMTMREPLKNFHKVFDSEEAFYQHFGDTGIEGTPGIRTSSFTGPQAGAIEAQAGIQNRPQTPVGTTGAREGVSTPPIGQTPQRPGIARELTMPRSIAPTTDRSVQLPKTPGPEPKLPAPTEPAKLTPEERDYVEGVISPADERWSFPSELEYGKPTGKIVEYGKPAPNQPGTYYRAGLGNTYSSRRAPAAWAKRKAELNDEWLRIKNAIGTKILRGRVQDEVSALRDGADNVANMVASNAGQEIRLTSLKDIPTGLTPKERKRFLKAEAKEAGQRREAAVAAIATGKLTKAGVWYPVKNYLGQLRSRLATAETRIRTWEASINPLNRIEARRDRAYVEKLKAILDYAENHWDDPEFQRTVLETRKQLQDAIDFENANGFDTPARENYWPARYEGTFWADQGVIFPTRNLLGSKFGKPKAFPNIFEAIVHGPFRMANLDAANVVEHRVMQGRKMVEMDLWKEKLKSMNDPASGKPLAVQPKQIPKTDPATGVTTYRSVNPSLDYVLVQPRPSMPAMAVLRGYDKLVNSLVAPSRIEEFPGGETALQINGALKHGVILLWDTFHPGRIAQYAMAINGKPPGNYGGGYSALQFAPGSLPQAVAKGLISQKAADWAMKKIDVGRGRMVDRQTILRYMVQQGFNATKISDALYRSAVEAIPFFGGPYKRLIEPYNHWLFQELIPGVMAESAVVSLEKAIKANPKTPLNALINDVVRDMNTMYGNMGRQGIFKSKTFQQAAQLLLLAPVWQEGLVTKELKFYSRLAGGAARAAGIQHPYRKGLPPMGALGSGMAKGLLAYLVGTQVINLITRQQLTFQNEEEGHKLDAFIPIPWSDGKGIWVSPMSSFAEATHDIIRLSDSKGSVMEGLVQMGENRMSPVAKMGWILASGKDPMDQYYANDRQRLWGGLSQIVPLAGASPIAFSAPTRFLASKIAPETISPPTPGTLERQVAASAFGVKVEGSKTPGQQIFKKVQRFMKDEGLDKTRGWKEVQTTDESYTKLRTALRNEDIPEAKKQYKALLEGRTRADLNKAMRIWARRPFTGSHLAESVFKASLNPNELEMYRAAQMERMELLHRFQEFAYGQ